MDHDLVEQAQHGDQEAFAILARTHGDRLLAIAQRILRDIGRAEDAVQQTLVIAWRELPRLRDPDRFDAWLQRLLVNATTRKPVVPVRGTRTCESCRSMGQVGGTRECRSKIATGSTEASGDCRPTSGRSSSSRITWASPRPRSPSDSGSPWDGQLPTPLRPPGDARGHRGRRASRRGGRRATPMTDQPELDRSSARTSPRVATSWPTG